MSRRSKPAVAVIGAGRVGQTLARLLAERGYPIAEVVSRTGARSRAAVAFIGQGESRTVAKLASIEADVVLVTVPDDAIRGVAERLARAGTLRSGSVALHASGARDAGELVALRTLGVAVGSMHPLQTFPSPELATDLVEGSVFAIEGDRRAVTAAVRMASDLGGHPVRLRPGTKALYHAAAVLASGGVTALLDMSLEAMERAGLTREEAARAVLPLVEGTVANVRRVGTASALTGPFARGDSGTIARNRAALAAVDTRLQAVYDALGERGLALRRGPGDR